jgi:hypothetical protein
MLTPSKRQQLLDDVDDARYELKVYKIKRNLLIVGIVFSFFWTMGDITFGVFSTVTATFNHSDLGGLVAGLLLLGVFGVIGTSAGLANVIGQNAGNKLRKKIRKAERQLHQDAW